MTRIDAIKFVAIRSLGNFLLLFALYGVGATFGPVIVAEVQFSLAQAKGVEYRVENPSQPPLVRGGAQSFLPDKGELEGVSSSGFADVAGEKEQILTPKDTLFSIVIPKIGASSQVLPNIDPTNPAVFLPALQKGVAHAQGTVFPGMPGNVYLFAHSADTWWNVGRYNAVFYLLPHLAAGDEIVVFFEHKRFDYVVTQTLVADADDISLLTQVQGGKERLVLQTCWPPGTTWKRFFVVAEPKKV